MTHVYRDLNAKVRRNEQLWQTLDIGDMFGPKFHNNFNLRNTITEKNLVLLISIFLHGEKTCTALYLSKSSAKSLK